MKILQTSHYLLSSVKVVLCDNVLKVESVPQNLRCHSWMTMLRLADKSEADRQYFNRSDDIAIDMSNFPDGTYFLNIYYNVGNQFWAFFSYPLKVVKKSGHSMIAPSPYIISNAIKYRSWSSDEKHLRDLLRPNSEYQSQNGEIIRCARSITSNCIFTYSKMLAIHDFVASNIAYDIDALRTGQYRHDDNSALSTLRKGRGVCQGYTNLSIALLRSIGIPSMEVECFALGRSTDGGWDNLHNREATSANHVFTAAYVNHRWCLMDITWDSNLEYAGGSKDCSGTDSITHRYFDMTLNMLSLTHKLL